MKYLFINSVAGSGSTGRIAADECRRLQAEGHECVIAYGRWKSSCDDIQTVRIGTEFDYNMHGVLTRLFDMHGFGSKKATAEFLEWIKKYDPDIIWLHNIHGYYINIEMLFDYLRSCGKTIKWTLHDCWTFTGHCAYFTAAKCDQWKSHCSNCPQLNRYPKCSFIGNAEKNFERKRTAFTGIPNLTLITPSRWLKDMVKQSFLQEYPVEVVYNKIDTNAFKPTSSNFRSKYGLDGKIILLGVANVWEARKGLDDFYKLACMLDGSYAIILVGLSKKQIDMIPRLLNGIVRSEDNVNHSAVYTSESEKKFTEAKAFDKSERKSAAVAANADAMYKTVTGEDFKNSIGAEKNNVTIAKLICIERTESQKELAAIYTAADLFLNPTYEDNYPTVNLEAQACGTPVITYDVGGASETLRWNEER